MIQVLPQNRLIVFTRYPEPGKTKTRMIPALGVEGAANLQRQMTEHTLAKVQELQTQHSLSVEVYFAGGTLLLMEEWLGKHWHYQPQTEGILGERMAVALKRAFEASMSHVVMIGIDCPSLTSELLSQSLSLLHSHDIVLGPARDGGYYLIGLRCWLPELFVGIPWGTAQVWEETMKIAQKLGVTVAQLPLLNDVDRPEDLAVWENFKKNNSTKVSPARKN